MTPHTAGPDLASIREKAKSCEPAMEREDVIGLIGALRHANHCVESISYLAESDRDCIEVATIKGIIGEAQVMLYRLADAMSESPSRWMFRP